MPKHYHVLAGLRGGYLPNSNEIYSSKRAAFAGARWRVASYRDEGEKVRGGNGFWIARESESLPGTFWDSIEVTGPCFDDCSEDCD